MHRSIMIMLAMGLIGMLLLTMFASFFIGQVGGAENVASLRKELVSVFGSRMAEPEKTLRVSVVRDAGETGLRISFSPNSALAKNRKALTYHLRRMATYVLAVDYWRKRVAFLDLDLRVPGKEDERHRFRRGEGREAVSFPESG